MKKSRFSEEQIAYALRMGDGGIPVVDVCRQIGISEPTFYTWKKKYGELGLSEVRKLRHSRLATRIHHHDQEVKEQGTTYTLPQPTITASASTPGSRFNRREHSRTPTAAK